MDYDSKDSITFENTVMLDGELLDKAQIKEFINKKGPNRGLLLFAS